MPSIYLISMEIVMAALFVLCAWHAARKGPEAVFRLLAGILFGVLLELATIQQLQAYSYGTFLVMLSDVPLAIGFGWGTIIYSAMLTSDATDTPVWVRPIVDGLLALNIDLTMDAVAIRLDMWDWGMGLQVEYFGVPYGNFWAWFWVVVSFSAGLRWLSTRSNVFWRWFAPIGAVLIGLTGVLATNAFIVYVVPDQFYEITVGLTLSIALILVLWQTPKFTMQRADPPAFWVPFGFHAFFLAAGLLSGVILNPPILLVVSMLMFTIALYLHRRSLPWDRG